MSCIWNGIDWVQLKPACHNEVWETMSWSQADKRYVPMNIEAGGMLMKIGERPYLLDKPHRYDGGLPSQSCVDFVNKVKDTCIHFGHEIPRMHYSKYAR